METASAAASAVAVVSSPEASMRQDPEQRFLAARQARLSSSSSTTTVRHTAQATATFWSQLRPYLQEWKGRLDQLQTSVDSGSSSSSRSRPESSSSSSLLSSSSLRQDLQNLKEELHRLRQHCLHHEDGKRDDSRCTTSPFATTTTLQVPEHLPSADWRLLHEELTRCTTRWETIHAQLFPKGKFTLTRYRAEIARRQALGIPFQEAAKPGTESSTYNTSVPGGEKHSGSTVQNISNATIWIRDDGMVEIQSQDETGPWTTNASLSATAVCVLRNIQNCTLQMYVRCDATIDWTFVGVESHRFHTTTTTAAHRRLILFLCFVSVSIVTNPCRPCRWSA